MEKGGKEGAEKIDKRKENKKAQKTFFFSETAAFANFRSGGGNQIVPAITFAFFDIIIVTVI